MIGKLKFQQRKKLRFSLSTLVATKEFPFKVVFTPKPALKPIFTSFKLTSGIQTISREYNSSIVSLKFAIIGGSRAEVQNQKGTSYTNSPMMSLGLPFNSGYKKYHNNVSRNNNNSDHRDNKMDEVTDIEGGNLQRNRSDSNAGLGMATRDQIVKDPLLHQIGEHHYAIATTDTAFKHMLSISMGSDPSIVISFLNCFVPPFRGDPVVGVKEVPVTIPALRQSGEKQTFMNFHVVCSKGTYYIIEIQAQRNLMFDERANLFYACGTYARQLSERELSKENRYIKLKPVISLQILENDTNRIRGLKAEVEVPDTLVGKVKEHPLPPEQFIKHYILSDKSGQEIDYLQMIQVELPHAENIRSLFPPQADFTLADWWVSVLRHAQDYTSEKVAHWYNGGEGIMPIEIYNALNRLDLQQWNPRIVSEYREKHANRDLYAATLAVEYLDGQKAGLEKGEQIGLEKGEKKAKREAVAGMRAISLNDALICQALQINEQQLQELINEEEDDEKRKK